MHNDGTNGPKKRQSIDRDHHPGVLWEARICLIKLPENISNKKDHSEEQS